MFKLLRRISVGVIPRPDRPWDEDATSNAPRTNRKRRLSPTERDEADEGKAGKKVRGDSATPSVADADATFLAPSSSGPDTKEVKEVTRGVREVELEDEPERVVSETAPEFIPLPEERSGELDEPASDDASDILAPTDDVRASNVTKSAQVAVGESTAPALIRDCEGPKHHEDKDEPSSDVAEPILCKKP